MHLPGLTSLLTRVRQYEGTSIHPSDYAISFAFVTFVAAVVTGLPDSSLLLTVKIICVALAMVIAIWRFSPIWVAGMTGRIRQTFGSVVFSFALAVVGLVVGAVIGQAVRVILE